MARREVKDFDRRALAGRVARRLSASMQPRPRARAP